MKPPSAHLPAKHPSLPPKGLLTNRTVRNFLFQFAEPDWPHVTKLLVLYGIQALELEGVDFQHLTSEQLRQRVVAQGRNIGIRAAEPGLNDALTDIRSRLHAFEAQIADVSKSPLAAAAPAPQTAAKAGIGIGIPSAAPAPNAPSQPPPARAPKAKAFPFNYEVNRGSEVHFYRVKHGEVDMTAGRRKDPQWRLGDDQPLSVFGTFHFLSIL